MADAGTNPETKRDRVRRLLIDPLAKRGFRFPRAVPEADGRATLDAIADAVAYMSDLGLERLRVCLESKGDGSRKDFWPSRACFETFAQIAEPRPLPERPTLLRWFASEAGAAALRDGRHVSEYLFWQSKAHPPVNDRDRRLIAERGRDMAARAARISERMGRGLSVDPDDQGWLDWYRALDQRVVGYIETERKGAA
jgi:hypothetical protein